MKHNEIGFCLKCQEIFNAYPNFHPGLKLWFEKLQLEHPDAHISAAGRGHIQQEEFFERGASRAHYGQSSHNFNAAIDIFQLKDSQAFWTRGWFLITVKPNLTPDLKWYGERNAEFPELPHVEVANWKELVQQGELTLVEKIT